MGEWANGDGDSKVVNIRGESASAARSGVMRSTNAGRVVKVMRVEAKKDCILTVGITL